MTTSFDTSAFVANLQAHSRGQGYTDGTADRQVARWLDDADALAPLRKEYYLPTAREATASSRKSHAQVEPDRKEDESGHPQTADEHVLPQTDSLYLCGNSLGPLARRSKQYVEEELDAWRRRGVLGHFDHPYQRPWVRCEERVSVLMSDIVGAKPCEVVAMGTLTANLHTMLATFYKPQNQHLIKTSQDAVSSQSTSKPIRHKIIHEAAAFPSDQYALASAVAMAGHEPSKSLVPLLPRQGERTLRTEDILGTLEREASTGELALLLLGDVQYLTGQMFDVPTITRRARELGVIIGWDLAHAFANVPLALHDWDVDFAVWCTYKYGSSGPGGIAGAFVHERWGNVGFSTRIGREARANDKSIEQSSAQGLARPAGWWGHEKSTRFAMPDSFSAIPGAAGWQQSNPSALDTAALLGSLETLSLAPVLVSASQHEIACPPADFGSMEYASRCNSAAGPFGWGFIMPALRQKSQRLTAYLEHLLTSCDFVPREANISIVTPSEARFRGSQLSLCIPDTNAQTTKEGDCNDRSDSGPNSSRGHALPAPVPGQTLVARVHRRVESEYGLICDVRNPDMLRVAPVAQYSTFDDVWRAADAIRRAISAELRLAGKVIS